MRKAILIGITVLWGCKGEVITDTDPLSYEAVYQNLLAEYTNSEGSDKEYYRQRIIEAKWKANRQPENPGELMDAMALIKMTSDGETYSAGYRTSELRKAEIRNANSRVKMEALPWEERGPANVSGRIRTVVVDPSDASENTWFAASIGGGVWKTTDGGQSWVNKTPELSTLTTTTLAIAASNPNVMYVGTGMGYGRIVDLSGSGIWKSTDGGESWTQLSSTANGELLDAINRIVVSPDDPDLVLACANGHGSHLGPRSTENGPFGRNQKSGIFRSTDGGASWTQVYDPDQALTTLSDNRVQQIIPDPTNFNTLYASVNEVGVIKSTDAGATWQVSADDFYTPAAVGVPGLNGFGLEGISGRSELAIAPSDPNRIYASLERPAGQSGDVMMSTDGGATWNELIDSGSDPSWFTGDGNPGRNSGWFNNAITVHPFDENVVFIGGVNLYRIDVDPTDNTRTSTPIAWWTTNTLGLDIVHADHHWLLPIKLNAGTGSFTLLNANDGGIALSPDGGTSWSQFGNTDFATNDLNETPYGLNTTQFYAVDKKKGEDRYIGGLQDAHSFISGTDPGANSAWRYVSGGDGIECVWNYRDPNLVIVSAQSNFLLKSTNGGESFSPISGARTGPSTFLTKVANSKADPDLIMTIDINGVNRSDDFGDNWVNTPISGNWIGYRPFSNIEISLADPRVVWITSRLDADPANGAVGGVFLSTDGGLTFVTKSNSFPDGSTESSGMATHPFDKNTAYFLFSVPGSPKILKTTDQGASFEDISGFGGPSARFNDIGFPDVAVYSLLVMPHDDNIIWAGTEIGLFITEDGGASWTMAPGDLPNVAIFQMSIVDGQVLLATQGRGIWTVDLPELADYAPPVVTLVPRVLTAAMSPNGMFEAQLDLRSSYDEVEVMVNGQQELTFGANASPEIRLFSLEPTSQANVTIQIIATKDGETYKSSARTALAFPAVAQDTYVNTFEDPNTSGDFIGSGFFITNQDGFRNSALHSTHPYPDGAELTYQLKIPITVAQDVSTIRYKDVVLVEEGVDPNHTDPSFFDFVIVEGSSDGVNWIPLGEGGYDSRASETWSAAINADFNTLGDATMYEGHFIDLKDTFEAGENIFLRFRLVSDFGNSAWGWAIDNLIIQDVLALSVGKSNEILTQTFRSYPNPAIDEVEMSFDLSIAGQVNLHIMDLGGRILEKVDLGFRPVGSHSFAWDASMLNRGIYLVSLETGTDRQTLRLIKQ